MNNAINKIKSLFKGSSAPTVSFQKKGIKPRRDWSIILFIVFIAVCVLAGFSYYFYLGVSNGTYFTISNEDIINEVKINNPLLNKISTDIKDRENSLVEIKNGKVIPANPAL